MKNALRTGQRGRGPAGFTIIEILVVVAIITVLLGLMMAYLGGALKSGTDAATKQTLAAIGHGLDSYYSDFNIYPPSRYAGTTHSSGNSAYSGLTGGQFLTEAMLGWMDYGDDGAGPANPLAQSPQPPESLMGFRITPGGKGYVYPARLPVSSNNYRDSDHYFLDANGNAIYYYQAEPAIVNGVPRRVTQVFDPSMPADATTAVGSFVQSDNNAVPTSDPAFLKLLGSSSGNTFAAGDTIINTTTYLLVAPDSSGTYGNKNNIVNGK